MSLARSRGAGGTINSSTIYACVRRVHSSAAGSGGSNNSIGRMIYVRRRSYASSANPGKIPATKQPTYTFTNTRPQLPPQPPQKPSFLRRGVKVVCILGLTLLTIQGVVQFIGYPAYNVGPSMEPTLCTEGEITFINRFDWIVRRQPVRRGDVVISLCPTDKTRVICKRVLAVENEVVIRDQLFGPPIYTLVPPGHVYLKGDNPYQSRGTAMFESARRLLIRFFLCEQTLVSTDLCMDRCC
jgi:signal peptidase I